MAESGDQQRMESHRVGRLAIFWHDREAPREDDWNAALTLLSDVDLATLRVLVLTKGGAPTATQRARLGQVVHGPVPVAVVSDHVGVRFVASTLALFMKRIKTFRTDELPAAYAHLDLSRAEASGADGFLAKFEAPG